MLTVLVHIRVKKECVEAFREESLENAKNSILELGIARFDVLQQEDDPCRFVLVEVYRSPEAPARHKETAHYKTWRERVESMMAEPRHGIRYTTVFTRDEVL